MVCSCGGVRERVDHPRPSDRAHPRPPRLRGAERAVRERGQGARPRRRRRGARGRRRHRPGRGGRLRLLPAANRDPSVYTEPDRLDLARNEAPHLAFGHGAHYCAGAQLARMEAEVMPSTFLTRFPGLATAVEPERIAWRRGTVNRGPVALPVTW
ncbi:cytochrome P450 [Streptomyces gardneri]|uniref:cytochrome P450 n=1 Tax=Streptomyces gardneri TaxID=66892 RepID=UPI0035D7E820